MTTRLPAVTLQCPQCGNAFVRPAWKVRKSAELGQDAIRCSYACVHDAKRLHTPETKDAYHAEYRAKNRAWINEKQNLARLANHEKAIQQGRASYYRNLEINRRRAREYAANHRAESGTRQKQWYADNPDRKRFFIVRSNIACSVGVRPLQVPKEMVEARIAFLDVRRGILTAKADGSPKGRDEDSVHDSGGRVSDLPKDAHKGDPHAL